MTKTVQGALAAAREAAEKYRVAWEDARARKTALVEVACATKTHLPDNYWQEEHRAHGLYETALILVDVLGED